MTRKKKPTPKPRCKKGCTSFTVEQTGKGLKRTCRECGCSITEVARVVVTFTAPKGLTGTKRVRQKEEEV